jgi:hypothetical protein
MKRHYESVARVCARIERRYRRLGMGVMRRPTRIATRIATEPKGTDRYGTGTLRDWSSKKPDKMG